MLSPKAARLDLGQPATVHTLASLYVEFVTQATFARHGIDPEKTDAAGHGRPEALTSTAPGRRRQFRSTRFEGVVQPDRRFAPVGRATGCASWRMCISQFTPGSFVGGELGVGLCRQGPLKREEQVPF